MGTTPVFALPYVEPTDTLATYPAAMQANALAVEAVLTGGPGTAFGWGKASVAQSIPNASATVLAVTLDGAISTGVTQVGNQLRAPTNGLYLVNAFVSFAANATGSRSMFIRRNNANLLRVTGTVASTTGTIAGSLVYPMAAGDLIDIQAYQSSGAALNTDAGSNGCSFQLTRL